MLRYRYQWAKSPVVARSTRKAPRKALGVVVGSQFSCGWCGDEHILIPCENPKFDYLFYSCDGKLQLAAIGDHVFI